MNNPVLDFTDAEQKLVTVQLFNRYGKFIPMQLADSELQLDAATSELTVCPTLYWTERGAQFVICKTNDGCYRSQFFYSEADHYGTGIDEYKDLEACVVTLLQVQSDHERQLSNISSGATAANLDDEYYGPMVI